MQQRSKPPTPLTFPKPLPPQKLIELLAAAQAGDRAALDSLVAANLRLVHRQARRMRARRADFDDLVQAGIAGHGRGTGLINAIMTYDLARPGASRSSWLAWAARGVRSAMVGALPSYSYAVTSRRALDPRNRTADAPALTAQPINRRATEASAPFAEPPLDAARAAALLPRLPLDQQGVLRRAFGFGREPARRLSAADAVLLTEALAALRAVLGVEL